MTNTPRARELRHFGLLMAAAVILMFALFLPWLFSWTWPLWPWLLAASLTLLALLRPMWLSGFERQWMRFGALMHHVNTWLLLGMVYYFVLTPIGLIWRSVYRDPLGLRRRPDLETYFVPSKPRARHHMEKPF